uniref:Uncharacterized protein n=1 Tax=Megaviridae environmental sample TaxID=1737588 RepID=A0A5J6VM48_9VIRU|nr:MAG: hypothetical protein [Megaviridae environmental sample]
MSGTTAIASLPNNTQQLGNNVGINISEKIPQQDTVNSQIQMQNVMNNQISSTNIQQQLQPQLQPQLQQQMQPQLQQQQMQPQMQPQMHQQLPSQIQQQEMNTLVSNIQQASMNGGTTLPSRDIPTNTSHLAIDRQIQQNNIPENDDYLSHMPEISSMINRSIQQKNRSDNYSVLFEEAQLPLLVSLLFLLYHIPVTKLFFKQNLPFIFNNEQTMTLKGNITLSILFGLTYYIGVKLLDKI